MSQLLNSYPVFEGNQVLTSTQLNQMVAYLDEQNRLTRAKLIGTGIPCGLELTYDDPGDEISITISKGMGVTSQGYLITLGDCIVTQYREYNLPGDVSYAPFEDPETKVQDVVLYEMLTQDAEILPGQTVLPLGDPAGFLDDKIVLLFLECSDNDLKSCLGQSCDERGVDRVFNVRKLLISKSDMQIVLSRTCTSQSALFPNQYTLPEIIIERVLFDAAGPESNDYFDFSQNYVSAIQSVDFVSNPFPGKNGLFEQLFEALRQTYTDFAAILAPVYGGANPFPLTPDSSWADFLNGNSTGPNYLGMQYFYDFTKDLILAYNEFRDNAFELMSECCMDMDCFPKHLMLGEAVPTQLAQPSEYRNGWVLSPAFDKQEVLLNKAIMLHKRMVIMTRQFDLAVINNPSIEPVPPSQLGEPLFITPSKEKCAPLSLRSIPYYYNITDDEPGLGTLEANWNYEFISKYLFAKGLKPLSYNNQNIVQSDNQGPVATPLYYDIDPYNFLRIEGAIRQNYVDVTAELNDLKNRFDLPFNILTLRLTGEPLDDITERCNFDDLKTEYGMLRTDILCETRALFDRYATNEGGFIQVKDFPAWFKALISSADSGQYFGSVAQPQTGELITFNVSLINGETSQSKAQPVYAPQRTMAEAENYLKSNLSQMVNKLNVLDEQMLPFNLTDFDFGYTGTVQNSSDGFIQTYLDAVQFAINAKVGYNQIYDLIMHSLKIDPSSQVYLDLMLYAREVNAQLENFITNCQHQKLTLLNYNYQYRLQYIFDNDQNLFSNFIQKHPGIEHTAGTPVGGTYIMLINGDGVTVNEDTRDVAVNQVRNFKATQIEVAKLELKKGKTVQDELTIQRLNAELVQTATVQAELATGTPVQNFLIENYQVIADFSLPYLCCCDCECDDIPAPTQESQLGMPALVTPFYVEYDAGDFAYSKPVNYATGGSAVGSIQMNIEPTFMYDRSRYAKTDLSVFLVDKNGTKLVPRQFVEQAPQQRSNFEDITFMSTYNSPNDPDNTVKYGTVNVRVSNVGEAPYLIYEPEAGFNGVDSFYCMFEIIGATGEAELRSNMMKVTVSVP